MDDTHTFTHTHSHTCTQAHKLEQLLFMPEALAVLNTWYMSKVIVHNGRNRKLQNGFLTNISAYTIVLPLLMGRLVNGWLVGSQSPHYL